VRLLYALYLRCWLRTDIFCNEYTWADAWEIAARLTQTEGKQK